MNVKKVKSYRPLTQNELDLLAFVAEKVTAVTAMSFPIKQTEWSAFCGRYNEDARSAGVELSNRR